LNHPTLPGRVGFLYFARPRHTAGWFDVDQRVHHAVVGSQQRVLHAMGNGMAFADRHVARHLDVDDEPFAARRARLFVKAACQDWQLDAAVCDDAVLVASELVGNAIAHARTACRLNVRLDARGLTIAVRDYDYGGLLNPLACTSAGRRGQGLFLVASVSRAWGATPTENGKRVWALLPITTAAR